MAKYSIKPAQPDGGVGTYFGLSELTIHGATRALYVDPDTGYQCIIAGRNLLYDGQQIIGGTITGITQKDQNGGTWYTITGAKLDGSEFPDVSAHYMPYYASIALRAGNDTILGSRGADSMSGYGGNDRLLGKDGDDQFYSSDGKDIMTGGSGNDEFLIAPYTVRDIITDFNANGDDDQIILVNTGDYETRDTKNGVLLTTASGASVLLEGLKVADLQADDIVFLT